MPAPTEVNLIGCQKNAKTGVGLVGNNELNASHENKLGGYVWLGRPMSRVQCLGDGSHDNSTPEPTKSASMYDSKRNKRDGSRSPQWYWAR